MAVGILGGTFDPPHVGHLILAETCADALHLSQVLWVPAADPPHKHGGVASMAAHRVAMVEAAIAGNARFALSRADVDRPGPHYSADMVALVAAQHAGETLYFLMGGDSLHDLPTWYEPARLLAQCRLAVVRRPFDHLDLEALEARLPGVTAGLQVVDAPLIDISGTAIRRRVRAGLSVRYWVTDDVGAYIQREGLYR